MIKLSRVFFLSERKWFRQIVSMLSAGLVCLFLWWVSGYPATAPFWLCMALSLVLVCSLADRKLGLAQGENERLLASALFDADSICTIMTDSHGHVLRVNRSFCAVMGYEAAEVLGKTPAQWASGMQPPMFYRDMWRSLHSSGRWEGRLWNRRKSGEGVPVHEVIRAILDSKGKVKYYLAQFRDLSAEQESDRQLQALRHYDALTGLPNMSMLEQCYARQAHPRALFSLKIVNLLRMADSMGFRRTDMLLRQAGARLQMFEQDGVRLFQFSRTNFAILCDNSAQAQADRLPAQLLAAFASAFSVEGDSVMLDLRVGIALSAEGGCPLEQLLQQSGTARQSVSGADVAVRWAYFEPEMAVLARRRFELETKLRHAIGQEGLYLHFQPQFRANDLAIEGVEALLRWRCDGQVISPAEFIPVAEESGLMIALGYWVLEEACLQLLPARGVNGQALRLAVNVSAVQLRDPEFADRVLDILERTGFAAEHLELEMTESALIEDPRQVCVVLEILRQHGITLAIDDFGTGHSSLAQLRSLPLDRLKIDRSFVCDLPENKDAAAIVSTVLAMARTLGMDCVAEGVETEGQLQWLAQQGCGVVQGFLLGRPAPIASFMHEQEKPAAELVK
ncbi:putative bifunctional diguanylate cyclase/phosphodiesterase [Craterilacuibacter sp.]|uniref:putative bifunctional diguanylate cyclase/phosphodiesterase n=1 Tax=Craterilacuibacter sp. TaxID=2870909 RepID=UPI003F3C6AFC